MLTLTLCNSNVSVSITPIIELQNRRRPLSCCKHWRLISLRTGNVERMIILLSGIVSRVRKRLNLSQLSLSHSSLWPWRGLSSQNLWSALSLTASHLPQGAYALFSFLFCLPSPLVCFFSLLIFWITHGCRCVIGRVERFSTCVKEDSEESLLNAGALENQMWLKYNSI